MEDIKSDTNKPVSPEPASVSPEQLMKMLDIQLAQQRGHRHERDSRMSFRIWSLALIIGGMILALCVLQWMLSQIPHGNAPHDLPPTQSEATHSTGGR